VNFKAPLGSAESVSVALALPDALAPPDADVVAEAEADEVPVVASPCY
jgi:hypothetical protein